MRNFLSIMILFGLIISLAACSWADEKVDLITISFETNNETRLHPLTYQRGESINLPHLQSVGGYLFKGWFLDEDFSVPVTNLGNIEENLKLYAKWEVETYDILIDVYNEVAVKSIHMNEIALFVLDDSGALYVQPKTKNPLYEEHAEYEPVLYIEEGFIYDPDDDGDTVITTWSYNAFAVHSNGSVYAWGDNTYGQLGTGDKVSSWSFIDITSQFNLRADETIIKMVGNEKTTFALTSLGNLYAWGANTYNMIGELETLERLRPTNINDQFCAIDNPYFSENSSCGEMDHFIVDIVVTDTNVLVLTNFHQVFLWGKDASEWFDENRLIGEHISEAVYMYLSGHIKHMVASSNTVVLISELDEILILGTSKLGVGTDHAWAGGPVKMTKLIDTDGNGHPDMLELMSFDPNYAADLTIDDAYLVANTLILRFSDDTLWGLGDNTSSLISHKKGYDYYKSLTEVPTNFVPQTLAMSSQEVCALDTENTLWCWGSNSTKNLNQSNEMILAANYRHVTYEGDQTNWEGDVEDPNALRSNLGPIKWMVPESITAAAFSVPLKMYTLTRYHISAIPPSITALEIANIINNHVCRVGSNDCDDNDPVVHPEAFNIYMASDGVIRWTFEIGVERARAGTTTATYAGN